MLEFRVSKIFSLQGFTCGVAAGIVRAMKINVTIQVEVDPQRWLDLYGCDDVRQDVRDYVFSQVDQSNAAAVTGAKVALK